MSGHELLQGFLSHSAISKNLLMSRMHFNLNHIARRRFFANPLKYIMPGVGVYVALITVKLHGLKSWTKPLRRI